MADLSPDEQREADTAKTEAAINAKPKVEKEAVQEYLDINNPKHANLTYDELQKLA